MPEIIVKLGDNIVQKNFFVKEPMRIGRGGDNEIVVENLAVSRSHATILHENGHYILTDLDSSNGTFVNGVRIKKTELLDRDVISIGKHKLYFYDQGSAESPVKPGSLDGDRTMMVESILTQRASVVVTKGRQKGKCFEITSSKTSIGRGSANDIQLSDWFVSREQAIIEQRGQQYFIRDLGSWHPTSINGKTMEEALLENGDVIQLGSTVQLIFSLTDQMQEQRISTRIPQELDEEAVWNAKIKMADSPGAGGHRKEAPGPGKAPGDALEDAENSWREGLELDLPDRGPLNGEVKDSSPESFMRTIPMSLPGGADRGEISGEAEGFESPWPEKVLRDPGELMEEDDIKKVELPESLDQNNLPENPLEVREAESPEEPAGAEKASAQDPTPDQEIPMWERALQNKNLLIRKQAARRLKQLTGKDYEY